MLIQGIKLKNWKNFKSLELALGWQNWIIGANATGKSNFLDVFRFLRTLAHPEGGGLQKAVAERGGIRKIRSLHATRDSSVGIEIYLSNARSEQVESWRYKLEFREEGRNSRRVAITEEILERNGKLLFSRPTPEDSDDPQLLTQTYLEQINKNREFRDLVTFFSEILYLHLVPQLLKFADQINGRILEKDPFGQGLLQRIAQLPVKTRESRLRKMQEVLHGVIPFFSELRFEKDENGFPHLSARFEHWRGHDAWQREEEMSDGTLRLIGLLWALLEGDSLLLLEEPELSLNLDIVINFPLMLDRLMRTRKVRRQILITTHSERLLEGVRDYENIIILEPSQAGTIGRNTTPDEIESMKRGLSPAEVLFRIGLPEESGKKAI